MSASPENTSKFTVHAFAEGSTFCFQCTGELDSAASDRLRPVVGEKLVDQDVVEAVFDFRDVWFLDTSGLEVVVRAFQELEKRGGRVVVEAALHTQPATMLMLSHLTTLFNVVWHDKPKDSP